MQLVHIAISNLMSFPYVEDIHGLKPVDFDRPYHGGINILIGPNGSGKSNILQILDQVLHRGLFHPKGVDRLKVEAKYPHVIQHLPRLSARTHNLYKNNHTPDKNSQVKISVQFSDYDFGNMHFIELYRDQLNCLIREFGQWHEEFAPIPLAKLRDAGDLTVLVNVDHDTREMHVDKTGLTPEQLYLVQYCESFFLIQELIKIYNYAVKKPADRKRFALRRTTATIPARRKLDEDTMHTLRVFKQHADEQNRVYKKINKLLQQYLDMQIRANSTDDKSTELILEDRYGNPHTIHELSGGQEGLMFLIITLLSFDLYKGILIVDEPEVHLHPQLQVEVLYLLQRMAKKMGLQCLVATNSPFFVNEYTIYHVYRCVNYNGTGTKVIKPNSRLVGKSSALIHMLKYGASAKIFFVNKIILVEGETDEYFFGYYLRWLKNAVDRGVQVTDYEFMNINGKGSYKERKNFLAKFGIQTYYIGDWDNIQEEGVDIDLNAMTKAARNYNQGQLKLRADPHAQKYSQLVRYIYDHRPDETQKIMSTIHKLYAQREYLLQWGAIETYLGLKTKGLDSIVWFLHDGFKHRLLDDAFAIYRKEFQDIFKRIFDDREAVTIHPDEDKEEETAQSVPRTALQDGRDKSEYDLNEILDDNSI